MGVTGFRVSGTIHALPGQLTGWQAGGGRRMREAGQPVEGAAGRPPRSVDPLRGRQALAVAQRVQQRCAALAARSEEHTSELQSQSNLVCRLLLEKKKQKTGV